MTTIAYKNGVLASDSQKTINGHIRGTAQKLFTVGGHLIGFAGCTSDGYAFMEWYAKREKARAAGDEIPEFPKAIGDEFEALIVTPEARYICYHHGVLIPVQDKFTAIGSGAEVAITAMHLGLDACEAIEAAKKIDVFTGGNTVFMELPPVVNTTTDGISQELDSPK